MDVELALTVLQRVFDADVLGRQLPGLSHGHQADIEVLREGRPEEEPARFDGHDSVQAGLAVLLTEPVDDVLECIGCLKEGSDISEEDSRLRKVGDITDELLQVHGRRRV